MSPVGGQGLNIALRDAVVADNHLGPVLSGSGADAVTTAVIDAAAHAVVAERRPETDAIQKLQRRMPELLFAGGWRARFVVDVALPLLVRTGLARRMFRSVFERLAHGVTEVRYHGLGRGLDSPP
jgi:2-polyprenyl-6-methoxyphenol hydroxylase-like FAD-dependent oxidoreductase